MERIDHGLGAQGKRRYSLGAMLFHWLTAIAVIWNWRLAESTENASREQAMALMADHKALGITILVLTIGRLLWRLRHPWPPLPANYAAWEKALARFTHVLFYVLLIALPLGGWLATSLAGRPVDFFGLFTIPNFPVSINKNLAGSIFEIHATAGKAMLLLVVLHVVGALKHTFLDRDGGLFRMLPFGRV